MEYIIDGYNLIFSFKDPENNLQKTRDELVSYFQKVFYEKNIEGTLVFDGAHRRDEESGLSYPKPLIVVFSPKGQSADEYILEKLEISSNPKMITVVTNDLQLRYRVKGLEGKILSNESFIKYVRKKKLPGTVRPPKDSPENIERLRKIFESKLENED